jgi:hypothetical protein
MSKILKIQLSKAMNSRIIDRHDADYIMSIINITTSIDDALDFMSSMVSEREIPQSITNLENENLRRHIVISSSILDKIRSIEVTREELDMVS